MITNPLIQIQEYRQSIWLDNIERSMITSGELEKMVRDGLLGMTSNPTIFEKAISGSQDYDEQLEKLTLEGKGVTETLDALMIQDIQMATDVFLPVFEKTQGRDGFVSIEISPTLAYQTEETVKTVRKLHRRVDRKNVMIKVPSTPEGIPAIEELIGDGISINVTLIFSIETYDQVAKAYIAGLKRLHQKNQNLGAVRSVASVFVSRIDALVDKMLEKRLQASKNAEEKAALKSLIGKIAVANSKLIYQKFKENFGSKEFLELQKLGAYVQRPLWGSTGTKNPNYSDLLYVEELIGADTVNTIPSSTLAAFRDHGKVRRSIEEDLPSARAMIQRLADLGIDLQQVTDELQKQGVKAFADSHGKLMDVIAEKRKTILAG
jgi:transaldolase